MTQPNERRKNKYMERRLTRRDAIKAGGIAAVGLAFSKPIISTLRPPTVWAAVSPGPTDPSTPPTTTIVVSPSNLNGWQFVDEGTAGSTGALVSGPGTPPLGAGSVEFVLSNASQGMSFQYFNPSITGLRLSDITKLAYCTYVSSAPGPQAVALQINFDDDVTDGDTSWKGRLVFEPYNNNGTVLSNQWQCWDTLAGKWWASGAPANSFAPQSSPQLLADILAQFPNAGFNSSFGGLVLKAGSGWVSFNGNADALTLGINGNDTIFNFEG